MEIKWIQITTDIFDDEKIQIIETLPEADSIIVIWFKLLVLAGKSNNNGVFMINDKIPYNDEMLAAIFRRKTTTVRLALETFQKFGMIELVDNVITIPKWEKHQNIDGLDKIREKTRQRVALYRNKQLQITQSNTKCNVTGNVTVTDGNALDIDKELDIDKDIKNNIPDAGAPDVTQPVIDSQKPKKDKIPEEAYKDALLLAELHKQNYDSGFKTKETYIKNWASDIDKIHRLDGRDWPEIEAVIRWVQSNDFWNSNILSGSKLREKFNTVFSQMKNGKSKQMYGDSSQEAQLAQYADKF